MAEGLAIALSGHLFGVSAGAPRVLGYPPGGPGFPFKGGGVLSGCAAACLFARGRPAGAGVFGAVVITGMAQP